MDYLNQRVENIKIAYIGGGSRGWAWGLMSDLASVEDMCGTVSLYDIDYEAAQKNEVIGNRIKEQKDCKSAWTYCAAPTLGEALKGSDFVVVSILPGTFDEMESDVHAPEAYGIYQSVGDTAGPGGLLRALRSMPMFEEIGLAIKENCPEAWVINYTNPMTLCVRTLYKVFPEIKAFGCCHEVFGTQKLLSAVLADMKGLENIPREDIKVNVVGLNHFTWLTSAHYQNMDLFPLYKSFALKYQESGFKKKVDENWMNKFFDSSEKVKMDLFLKYGVIAAAGDRHLAEFCPGAWYLNSPEQVESWGFALTPVQYRKEELVKRLERSERLYFGEEAFEIHQTGEEGVQQIRALLGLRDLVTNVNIPNVGQIPNLPIGAVVETNAYFCADSLTPVFAGNIPNQIYPLISRVCGAQEMIAEAGITRNLSLAFHAFISDPNMNLPLTEAKELFDTLVSNTKDYLKDYSWKSTL